MRSPPTATMNPTPAKAPLFKAEEMKVFISNRDSKCDECGEELGRKAWITLDRAKGALGLACGDLDHLIFLPSGDAALTRRARKQSVLSAVVLKFSRARKRYERQGLLVEEKALEEPGGRKQEQEQEAGGRRQTGRRGDAGTGWPSTAVH